MIPANGPSGNRIDGIRDVIAWFRRNGYGTWADELERQFPEAGHVHHCIDCAWDARFGCAR